MPLFGERPLCEEQGLFQLQEELALQGLREALAHKLAVMFVKNGPFGSCNLLASVLGCARSHNHGPKGKLPASSKGVPQEENERDGLKRES